MPTLKYVHESRDTFMVTRNTKTLHATTIAACPHERLNTYKVVFINS